MLPSGMQSITFGDHFSQVFDGALRGDSRDWFCGLGVGRQSSEAEGINSHVPTCFANSYDAISVVELDPTTPCHAHQTVRQTIRFEERAAFGFVCCTRMASTEVHLLLRLSLLKFFAQVAWHDLGIWQIQCETSSVFNILVEFALRTAMFPALTALAVETCIGTNIEDEMKALDEFVFPMLEYK